MAVDKRTARMGVLATAALVLMGLLGDRLWFLQGQQADEYPGEGDLRQDPHRVHRP